MCPQEEVGVTGRKASGSESKLSEGEALLVHTEDEIHEESRILYLLHLIS